MSDIDDDDLFLYGESEERSATPTVAAASFPPSEPKPISIEEVQSATNGLVAQLEKEAASEAAAASDNDSLVGDDELPPSLEPPSVENANGELAQDDMEAEGDGDGVEEEDDSEDDVEFIMEPPTRSLDFRRRPTTTTTTTTTTTPNRPPPLPAPSLTTEYTPRERGAISKLPSLTPQPTGSTPQPPGTSGATPVPDSRATPPGDMGPDPNTLPVAIAPPSHPTIDPSVPGTLDGRSIFEFDMDSLAEKPWRRPGSDISDWFNYGFDEISWEAYCYRRRESGELASMLKGHVLNFAGMSEEQLAPLPPEIRTMVMTGATAMLAQVNNPQNGGGMMPPGAGMNMNGNMMNSMMNMNAMMNPMMQDMGVVGMNGEMAMGPGMSMGGGVMSDGGMVGGMPGGVGMGGQGGQATPEQMGMVGDGFNGNAGGQQMMAMGPEFGMQEQNMGQQMGQQMNQQMGQQMGQPMGQHLGQQMGQQIPQQIGQPVFTSMESSVPQGPTPQPPRAPSVPQSQFRGRGLPQSMARGRGAPFAGRGRGGQSLPTRPASPLPPNVPTGPRNKNKYKDIDGSAPAVDGLDYGGGGGKEGRGTPDYEDRSRKRRGSPGVEDPRNSKRR